MTNKKFKIIISIIILFTSFMVFKFIYENTMDGKNLKKQNVKTFNIFGNKYEVSNIFNWKLFNGYIEIYYNKRHALKGRSHYKNGKLNGIRKMWYENGTLKYEIPFVNGKVNGVLKKYDINGELYTKINHVDGYMDGKSYIWHKNKDQLEVHLYKESKLIKHFFVDLNSSVLKNIRGDKNE